MCSRINPIFSLTFPRNSILCWVQQTNKHRNITSRNLP